MKKQIETKRLTSCLTHCSEKKKKKKKKKAEREREKKEMNKKHYQVFLKIGTVKNVFLETSQNSQENTCARVSFLIMLQVFLVPTLVQVFSCEFCEISKNIFFHRTPLVAASGYFGINLLRFH